MSRILLLITLSVCAISFVTARPSLAQSIGGFKDPFGVTVFEEEIALENASVEGTAIGILNVAMSLLGIVALVIILIGGFQWMMSGGNEEKIEGAQKLLFAGVVGLVIILSAWAIARFVIQSVSKATGSGTVEELPK